MVQLLARRILTSLRRRSPEELDTNARCRLILFQLSDEFVYGKEPLWNCKWMTADFAPYYWSSLCRKKPSSLKFHQRMEADNRYSPGIFGENFQAYEEVGRQEALPLPIPSRRPSLHIVETRTDQIPQPKGPETSSKIWRPGWSS